jgi:hypothetical protein
MNRKTRFWLPSFADIFFCCCFLRLTLSSDSWLLNDADTGYHIRAGEYILHTFIVPRHDIFSYIAPPLPWVAHEWLSETIMALIHKFSGLTGIVIIFSFLIGLTYFVLFRFAQSLKCDFFITALIVLLATASSSIHWFARPHIFSLILTIVWYGILDTYQHQGKDRLYLLPFLMLLWVNLHGGFIVAFVLLAIYFTGNLMAFLLPAKPSKGDVPKEKCKKLVVVAALCLLFSLLNPRGYSILLFPFRMVSNHFIMDNVVEFLSPNFHQPLPYKYLLLLTVGVLFVSRTALNAIEIVLVLFFTYMSLYSARYIPLFAIIIMPILVRKLQAMSQELNNRPAKVFREYSKNLKIVDASSTSHLWPIISIVAVCALAVAGKIEFKFDETRKPVAAVEFLKREKLPGKMFNDDEFGDYLIYAAWPEYRVFFDGRSDMYGEIWGAQYMKVATLQPDWEKIIEKHDFGWIFSPAASPLSTILLENKNWHLVYADKVAEIFIKKIPENRFLINKYPDVKPVDSKA